MAEAVAELRASCRGRARISFRRSPAAPERPLEVIVRFLALLELYKQGAIDLDQGQTFGELDVTWLGPRPTTYGGGSGRRRPSTVRGLTVAMLPRSARAIEAMLMVAVEPVRPRLLAELLESRRSG